MKDENCGNIMTEFIGLRSKMYSFKLYKNVDDIAHKVKEIQRFCFRKTIMENIIANFGITKKAKGIQASAVKVISFDE